MIADSDLQPVTGIEDVPFVEAPAATPPIAPMTVAEIGNFEDFEDDDDGFDDDFDDFDDDFDDDFEEELEDEYSFEDDEGFLDDDFEDDDIGECEFEAEFEDSESDEVPEKGDAVPDEEPEDEE